MMRKVIYIWAAVALFGVAAVAVTGLALWSKGFSSRPQPSDLESSVR